MSDLRILRALRHWLREQDPFRRCADVFAQLHHFVDGHEDMRHNELCQGCEKVS
jgi:hypothetical protein